jgi:pimeloyl-ACP methyl ester carboxylesterase
MKRHDALVEGAVLAAPEGPDHTLKRPLRIQEHLERMSRLAGIDLAGTLQRILERLEQSPAQIPAPVGAVMGRFDLAWIISESLADTRALQHLPAWVARMERGEFGVIAEERLMRNAWEALRVELPLGVARYAMDCASGATAARRRTIERESRETLLGNTIDFPLPETCDAVGCPDLGDEFRAAPRSDVRVLFVTGTLDCRTPAENVAELAPGLPNHQHLVVDDAGHGDLLLATRVQAAIAQFLGGHAIDSLNVSADEPFAFAPF